TLVMPYAFDQPDNAARLQRLGISSTIAREKYTVRRVADELTRLLADPRRCLRAAQIARELERENGAGATADAIERQLNIS
ncbi:MAG: glycosyltransferase, partial [Burkholderiaceae bacterium]